MIEKEKLALLATLMLMRYSSFGSHSSLP